MTERGISDDMIERAAQAAYDWWSDNDTPQWDHADEQEREQVRDHARNVLEAALSPTETSRDE